MNWLEEKNFAPRTRRLKLAALKSFCSYLTYIDPVHLEQWHEIKELKINIKPKDSIKYITVEAITSLLESIPLDTQKGRRDFALLTIMYYTGARVNEMILMSPADIRISKPLSLIHIYCMIYAIRLPYVPLKTSFLREKTHIAAYLKLHYS